jgi:hypothetical protein
MQKVRKVVAPGRIMDLKRKVKVVGDFCFVFSFCCFSIDVIILYVVYPNTWVFAGCCGIFGMLFLIMAVVCWNVDRAVECFNKMRTDLEKYFRSGKLIMLIFCLLFLFLLYFVLKYVLV